MTPDAYAGNINSPTSQKPFIWNANNALEYADPTGYDVYIDGVYVLDGFAVHLFAEVITGARADVYEAGNVFAKWPVGVLERQYYGDDINPAKSTGTPVYPAGVPVPPPTGMTQAQWDERARAAFGYVSMLLSDGGVPYSDIGTMVNSNTFVALGFRLAGLSDQQVQELMHWFEDPPGSSKLSIALLEQELFGASSDKAQQGSDMDRQGEPDFATITEEIGTL